MFVNFQRKKYKIYNYNITVPVDQLISFKFLIYLMFVSTIF